MASVPETDVLEAAKGGSPGVLARERTMAGPRFSRWPVPTAALAIHLSIGMA